jgi:hypothetical protein
MTPKHRSDDPVDIIPVREDNKTVKNVLVAIIIFCVTGWVAFITTSAIINKENNTRLEGKVNVIDNDHQNLKQSVYKIESIVVEIRKDQIRKYGK